MAGNFAIVAVLGALSIGLTYAESGSTPQMMIAIFTCVTSAVCYAIIPATNRASDTGNPEEIRLAPQSECLFHRFDAHREHSILISLRLP